MLDEDRRDDKEIAQLAGISPSSIPGWKTGEFIPKADNLAKLAKVLGVSPIEFFESEESELVLREGEDWRRESEVWKKRAKLAEKDLSDLRDGLRALLERSAPTRTQRPSSKPASVSEEKARLLDAAEDKDRQS